MVTLPASAADHARPERSRVTISDVQYDSPSYDDGSNRSLNREWVEVTNNARRSVNLDGSTLQDEDGKTYTFEDYRLEGRTTVRIHTGRGRDTDTGLYQDSRRYVGTTAPTPPPTATTTDATSTATPGASTTAAVAGTTTTAAAATTDPTPHARPDTNRGAPRPAPTTASDTEPRWTLVRDPFGQYLAARYIAQYSRECEVVDTVRRRIMKAVRATGFVEGAAHTVRLLDERVPSIANQLLTALEHELGQAANPHVRRSPTNPTSPPRCPTSVFGWRRWGGGPRLWLPSRKRWRSTVGWRRATRPPTNPTSPPRSLSSRCFWQRRATLPRRYARRGRLWSSTAVTLSRRRPYSRDFMLCWAYRPIYLKGSGVRRRLRQSVVGWGESAPIRFS